MNEKKADIISENESLQKAKLELEDIKSSTEAVNYLPLYYKDVDVKDGYYGTFKEDEFIPFGQAVSVKRLFKNINTNSIVYELAVIAPDDTLVYVHVAKRNLFENPTAKELADKGAQVTPDTHRTLAKTIINQANSLSTEYQHTQIGFFRHKDDVVFGANQLIGSIESDYSGSLDIRSQGSFGIWEDMFKSLVVGNAELELAVAIGCVPIIMNYLNIMLICRVSSLIIHSFGDTSSGKTSAAKLALSVASNPNAVDGSLLLNWSSTENAILKILGNNYGYLLVVDELSMNTKDKSSFIYQFSSGKEKTRMSKNLGLSESGEWLTALFSTGELDIRDIASKNEGLLVRVISLDSITWTKDAKSARIINKICSKNFGHLAPMLVNHLLQYDKELIKSMYEETLAEFKDSTHSDHKLFDRIADMYVYLLLTHKLLEELLGIDMNYIGVKQLLVSNHDSTFLNDENNMVSVVIQLIISEITQNPMDYPLIKIPKGTKQRLSRGTLGFIEHYFGDDNKTSSPEKVLVLMVPDAFEKLISSHGFESAKILLKKLKEEGALICESDRYISRRKVDDIPKVNFYIFDITDQYTETLEELSDEDSETKEGQSEEATFKAKPCPKQPKIDADEIDEILGDDDNE